MSILDISRTLMYDFLYNYIKKKNGSSAAWPKAGDRAKLLFTDTDTLLYEIATEDFYKDISGDVEDKLDTSNYPEDRVSGIPNGRNKKVVRMMKDEAGGKVVEDFVGLRANTTATRCLRQKRRKSEKVLRRS